MEAEDKKIAEPSHDETAVPAAASAETGGRKPRAGALAWTLKLVLLAVIAAAIGAFVTSNWKDRPFSFVFTIAQANAGLVILASVALGFILAVVFLWGAFTRE